MLQPTPDSARAPALGFTLSHVAARQRFAVMREIMATSHPPLVRTALIAERDDHEAPFNGGMWLRGSGTLACVETASDALSFRRTAHEVATSPMESYGLYLQMEGVWHLTQGDRTQSIEPGGLVLLDANEPFQSVKVGRYRHRTIRIARPLLDTMMPAGWQRSGLVCQGDAGFGRVIAQYALALTDEIDKLSPRATSLALEHLCRLFAVHAGTPPDRAGGAREALRAAKLTQVRHYIEQHLAEAELTPAVVAAQHGMSQRSLHLLFEPTGASFAQHLQQRRLEACRALLTQPAHVGRSTTDIALSCGFNSLATFYRAFQRSFGMTPGELRAATVNAADQKSRSA